MINYRYGRGRNSNTISNQSFAGAGNVRTIIKHRIVCSRPPRRTVLLLFLNVRSRRPYRIRVLGLARVLRVDPFQTLERLVELAALQQEFRALREPGQPQGQQDAGQRAQRQEHVPRRVSEDAERVRGPQRDDAPGDHCEQVV